MREHLPTPSIILNIPTPLRIRVRHIVRRCVKTVRQFIADIRDIHEMTRLVVPHDFEKLRMAMGRAAYDAHTGGMTVKQETFIWKARETAYGRRSKKTVERIGVANVQERGPFYHNTTKV